MRASILALALLATVAAPVSAGGPAPPVPSGGEFVVNTSTLEDQLHPSVGARPDGGFVVAWGQRPGFVAYGPDDSAVFAQRLNRRGEEVGGEFRVNFIPQLGYSNFLETSTAVAGNGDFVVTWNLYDTKQIGFYQTGDIWMRRFSKDGVALGVEEELGFGKLPDVSYAADGSFTVVWTGSLFNNLRAQRFAPDGQANGPVMILSNDSTEYDMHPSVASRDDGAFLVVWSRGDAEGYFQGNRVRAQRYAADGSPIGQPFRTNPVVAGFASHPDAAALPGGGTIITWTGVDGDQWGVFGRLYDALDQPLGAPFQINESTTGWQQRPAVAVRGDGTFLVSWDDRRVQGGDIEAMARYFAADGQPLSTEFRLNDFTPNGQIASHAAGNGAGDFLVVWQSDGSDGDETAVSAKLFRTAELFIDGFESGTTAAWSAAVP